MPQQGQNLTATQRNHLYSLLLSYSDLFALNNKELGRTGINTGDASPAHVPPRRLTKHRQDVASTLLQQMLEKKVVTFSLKKEMEPHGFALTIGK